MANDAAQINVSFGINVPSENVKSLTAFRVNDTSDAVISLDKYEEKYSTDYIPAPPEPLNLRVSLMKLSTFRILPKLVFDHPSLAITASTSSRSGCRYCGIAARL